MTVTPFTSVQVRRGEKIHPAGFDLRRFNADVYFERATLALAENPKQIREIHPLAVLDQVDFPADAADFFRGFHGGLEIADLIHQAQFECFLAREDAAIGEFSPVWRQRLAVLAVVFMRKEALELGL